MKLVVHLTALAAAGALAAGAHADGLPVLDVDVGPTGVAAQNTRYVTLKAGVNRTLVARIDRRHEHVAHSRVLQGDYTVPAVAYDGSAAGLSADGRTLVLITPRPKFPRRVTTFAFLDARTLALRKRLALRGDFSFDALSPDARWLYLIRYTSPTDPLKYEVRAFDVRLGRLDPRPVIDPREPDEAMNGHPLTRATSPDGRWAYTLYEGADHPFVHALDTVHRDARCIDLDWLHGRRDLWQLRFGVGDGGRELTVRARGKPVAVVDTQTWEAARPAVDAARGRGSSAETILVLGCVAILAGLAGLGYAARARSSKTAAAPR